MNEPWSIEQEITAATGGESLQVSLVSLGICDNSHAECAIAMRTDWYRSGGETYSLEVDIRHSDGVQSQLWLKACVGLSLEMNGTSAIVESWLEKRRLLSRYGASTPQLFYAYRSDILEERIPYSLAEALSNSDAQPILARSLGETMAIVTECGFANADLHDVRSRGEDIVLVDFGEDLGTPKAPWRTSVGAQRMALNRAVQLLTSSLAASQDSEDLVKELTAAFWLRTTALSGLS